MNSTSTRAARGRAAAASSATADRATRRGGATGLGTDAHGEGRTATRAPRSSAPQFEAIVDEESARPSKTKRKQAMHALQELGEQLLGLTSEHWQQLALPPALVDALLLARTITAHEARRRQLQYIGRLMRQVDATAIESALASLRGASRASAALLHRCEQWRDRLLSDDAALTEFLAQHPAADAQSLRATIRAARRERGGALPPRHARLLYRAVRELIAPGASPIATAAETETEDS